LTEDQLAVLRRGGEVVVEQPVTAENSLVEGELASEDLWLPVAVNGRGEAESLDWLDPEFFAVLSVTPRIQKGDRVQVGRVLVRESSPWNIFKEYKRSSLQPVVARVASALAIDRDGVPHWRWTLAMEEKE